MSIKKQNEVTSLDLDKIKSHYLRIELANGSTLGYNVSYEAKIAFYTFLKNDAISELTNQFIWFYIPLNRLVLVNKKDIIRITFCYDYGKVRDVKYIDNFDIIRKFNAFEVDEDISNKAFDLPQLIIVHDRQKEKSELVKGVSMETEGFFGNISYYSDFEWGDVEGFQFDFLDDEEEWELTTYKYLEFFDYDGETNFMPLENLSVIEVERGLIMSDNQLDQYLEIND